MFINLLTQFRRSPRRRLLRPRTRLEQLEPRNAPAQLVFDTLALPVTSADPNLQALYGAPVSATLVDGVAQFRVAGDLLVPAGDTLVVTGSRPLALNVAGRMDVAASATLNGGDASLSISAKQVTVEGLLAGGSITVAADYFVNTGQVNANGANGGDIGVSTRDYLNAGTLSVQGRVGGGGVVRVDFSESYIDTATALTTANCIGGRGGRVTIDGGNGGRLFSSGCFAATGSSGGAIDLFGREISLVGATVDASGTGESGGSVRIGGSFQGRDANIPVAQTVAVTGTTTLRADGGGVVVVWSGASTEFAGSISAEGGGTIEVSSHGQLSYTGQADTGANGTLLLDPQNLVISAAPAGVFPQYQLVNPGSSESFGAQVVPLSTGNIVVTDPYVNSNVGAVYLFNGKTGALLSTLTGSTGGATGGDRVGSTGVTALSNGNYVVISRDWNGDPTNQFQGRGAVTWGSGTTGVSGVISAANSLVGSSLGDKVGGDGVTALTNGNYVVNSSIWSGGFDNGLGAVTWGNGSTGTTGVVSAANSLVGAVPGDGVGRGGVTALSNGNYVVSSYGWNGGFDNGLGAVTSLFPTNSEWPWQPGEDRR